MKKYKIEHKILTLAQCAVMEDGKKPATFKAEDVEFTHWEFNYRDGWLTNAWIASSEIEADGFIGAINIFRNKLSRLVPRISLISQSYIEFVFEPFLVHEISKDVAYFRYIEDRESCGLMFMQNEEKALKILLENKKIPEEFYYYWNDAVNTIGYSAKLLLMFSAIEALVKKSKGKKDWILINNILGEVLTKELFEDNNNGLRHRLVHGEYFGDQDKGKNYLELIHKKVIGYFNREVFSEILIAEEVVEPQRHLWGNKGEAGLFVKRIDGGNLFSIKELLEDCNKNREDLNHFDNYKRIIDKTLISEY